MYRHADNLSKRFINTFRVTTSISKGPGHLMTNVENLEEILAGIEKVNGISDALLVSRSGMHIAGDVPKGAHTETFVAMSAILLGAAETATSELKEKLRHVDIELDRSNIVIATISARALLVLKIEQGLSSEKVLGDIRPHLQKMEEFL
jgi:predicted regulator of Ras-like GTPase activity (Roadblock/LC7/MglB family)